MLYIKWLILVLQSLGGKDGTETRGTLTGNLPWVSYRHLWFCTVQLICFPRACVSGSLIIILLMSKLTLGCLTHVPWLESQRFEHHPTSVVLLHVFWMVTEHGFINSTVCVQEHGWRSPRDKQGCSMMTGGVLKACAGGVRVSSQL